jgi:hypothetical protein
VKTLGAARAAAASAVAKKRIAEDMELPSLQTTGDTP